MTSYVAPFHTLRLRAAGLLGRLLAHTPILKDRLPSLDARLPATDTQVSPTDPRVLAADIRVPHPRDSSTVARVGSATILGPKPSTAPQDLYRIWVCMKNRTDGRPCCAAGNGHGTAAELLAALQTEIARAIEADPTLAGRLDARPSGCLDLCDHALVAIAHTGPAVARSKPPKSRLDRVLHPRLAQFTDATPQDAQHLLQILLPPTPRTR